MPIFTMIFTFTALPFACTFGSHLNGKRIDCKMETYLKQLKKEGGNK